MKEFEWFERFEWFEWFGPSPIEPFISDEDERRHNDPEGVQQPADQQVERLELDQQAYGSKQT